MAPPAATGARPSIKAQRRQKETEQIEDLEKRCAELLAATTKNATRFDELPISKLTLKALGDANWVKLTEIQSEAIPRALAGHDVLGAAKTGSGKTLSFIVPMLEKLYRLRWNPTDGLGALIISPTRELAMQIFEVLRRTGRNHSFSAGLVIGGQNVKLEADRIARMNILVCTPGRLLQHMDQTVNFDCHNLQMLILDEADRILDMGFEATLNAIIGNLPPVRQTLLFSATQTKSIKDLARLSLKDPDYVAVHEQAAAATPIKLVQNYLVCELQDKIDILFSFVRSHLTNKSIVFLSACKQVRFVYETFRKMRPGVVVMCLHGKQKQLKRMAIYNDFCQRQHAVLFATDIAARGLDFPAVDWVVQADCPDDVETYIHRVGRTARYDAKGKALLMLLPSEAPAFLEHLAAKRVPLEQIHVNPSKSVSVSAQLSALCSQDPEVKYLAQKAFVGYMRSVFLKGDKAVFDVNKLPGAAFAEALGLPSIPKIRFVTQAKALKNAPRALQEKAEDDEEAHGPNRPKLKMEKLFNRSATGVMSEHFEKLRTDVFKDDDDKDDSDEEEEEEEEDEAAERGETKARRRAAHEEDDFLKVKRTNHELEQEIDSLVTYPTGPQSHRDRLKSLKRARVKASSSAVRTVFDDESGEARQLKFVDDETSFVRERAEADAQSYLAERRDEMTEADHVDKVVNRARLRELKLKRKMRAKDQQKGQDEAGGDGPVAVLGSPDDDDDEEEADDGAMNVDKRRGSAASSSHRRVPAAGSDVDDDDDDDDDIPAPPPPAKRAKVTIPTSLEDQEALALKLLSGRH